MIDEKCRNCPELVIPYLAFPYYGRPNPKMPEEYQIGTCRCNVDGGEGYYGGCHPDECHGEGHKYYFERIKEFPYRKIKFID